MEGDAEGPAVGEADVATAPGSASSTVSSCHSFHGWNQYSPRPTPTTASTRPPMTNGLPSSFRTRSMPAPFPENFPSLPIQRARKTP